MAEMHIWRPDKEEFENYRGELSAWWCQNEPSKGISIAVTKRGGVGHELYFTRKDAGEVLRAIAELMAQERYVVEQEAV